MSNSDCKIGIFHFLLLGIMTVLSVKVICKFVIFGVRYKNENWLIERLIAKVYFYKPIHITSKYSINQPTICLDIIIKWKSKKPCKLSCPEESKVPMQMDSEVSKLSAIISKSKYLKTSPICSFSPLNLILWYPEITESKEKKSFSQPGQKSLPLSVINLSYRRKSSNLWYEFIIK